MVVIVRRVIRLVFMDSPGKQIYIIIRLITVALTLMHAVDVTLNINIFNINNILIE